MSKNPVVVRVKELLAEGKTRLDELEKPEDMDEAISLVGSYCALETLQQLLEMLEDEFP